MIGTFFPYATQNFAPHTESDAPDTVTNSYPHATYACVPLVSTHPHTPYKIHISHINSHTHPRAKDHQALELWTLQCLITLATGFAGQKSGSFKPAWSHTPVIGTTSTDTATVTVTGPAAATTPSPQAHYEQWKTVWNMVLRKAFYYSQNNVMERALTLLRVIVDGELLDPQVRKCVDL